MLIEIPKVLSQQQLILVNQLIEQAKFVDGKLSAGSAAAAVKNNNELETDTPITGQLDQLVLGSLVKNRTFANACFTKGVAGAFYARYGKNMRYGEHVDDPIMGPIGGQYRSDISATVFLNNPSDYQGGELVISSHFAAQQYKLKAGSALIYPSSYLHQVKPVTQGQRFVAVTWIQSMIADPAQRELLFNLNIAREHLMAKEANSDPAKRLDISYANLIRMWASV